MGGGNPIKRVVSKVKKAVSKVRAEDVFSGGMTKFGREVQKATGAKGAGLIFGGLGSKAMGELGEKFIDKPKAAKAEAKRIEGDMRVAQQKQMADLKRREGQEKAEAGATERLERSKARQRRRRGAKGRGGTILTGKLGAVGGEENQGRKSLLGL